MSEPALTAPVQVESAPVVAPVDEPAVSRDHWLAALCLLALIALVVMLTGRRPGGTGRAGAR